MKNMKKLVALSLALIGLVVFLTGCSTSSGTNKENSSKELDLSIYNEGDELFEQGEFSKAAAEYEDLISKYKEKENYSEDVVSEGLIKIAKCHVELKDARGLENFKNNIVKHYTSNPSEKLVDYLETGDGSKRWFKVEGISDSSRGHQILDFKYDDKGRIVYSSEMYYCRPKYLIGDYYPYDYEYTDDGHVLITAHDKDDKRPIKLTVDEYNIITHEEYYDLYGEYNGSKSYNYSFDEPKQNDDVIIYMSKYGCLEKQKTVDGTYLDTDFDNEFDDYNNLIETYIYSSTESKIVHKYYKYVFCKPSELNGDLSEFPSSCSEYYDKTKELWW